MSSAPPLLVIAGATATGKTGLAIEVARALLDAGVPVEVISADSRQVFRGLDIGTAKATVQERDGVPHHGLDLVDPDEAFSVAAFVAHAEAVLARLAASGGLAILVGGTGLYLRALARGIDTHALPSDPAVRARLEEELERDGTAVLASRLVTMAPARAAAVDLRNSRRVVRALEIATIDGGAGPLPSRRGYGGPQAWIGLTLERADHDARIEARARAQFAGGLMEEARDLRMHYDSALPAFSAIGYREAWSVIDGAATLEEGVTMHVQRTRAFARRQQTWFRSEPGIEWLDAGGPVIGRALETTHTVLDGR